MVRCHVLSRIQRIVKVFYDQTTKSATSCHFETIETINFESGP